MAITTVQTTGKQTGTTSISLTLNSVAQGNTIIVLVSIYRAGGFPGFTVSDAAGYYSLDDYSFSGVFGTTAAGVFRLSNAASGTHSITVAAPTSTITAIAIELRSNFTPNRIFKDVSYRGSGTSGTAASVGATANTAANSGRLFAVLAADGTTSQGSITVASSPIAWTELIEHLATSSATPCEMDYFNSTSRGTVSASWTLASSVAWAAVVVAYAEVTS
jgi:hypothetical protein